MTVLRHEPLPPRTSGRTACHPTPRFAAAILSGSYRQYSGHPTDLGGAAQPDPKEAFPVTPADGRADREADIPNEPLHMRIAEKPIHRARLRVATRYRCGRRTVNSVNSPTRLSSSIVPQVLLDDDVVADRQAKPGALAGRICG